MRRTLALVAGLAVVSAVAAGCGVSSKEIIKPRDPAGQGETRSPDIDVEAVEELRAVEVVINRGRFQPQQVTASLDSTVRVVNGDSRTVKIRLLEGLAESLAENELEPGEKIELDFVASGTERLGLKGSSATLEINVYQPG